MIIYRCQLTLLEATFFSSREIGDLYQTEPLIGNYALAYALGFCQSAYANDQRIRYKTDLAALNQRQLYVTPAEFVGTPSFVLRRFNAQTDAYWSAYGAGVIVARSEYGWSEKRGQHWFTLENDGESKRHNPNNRPQEGRLRLLAAESDATFYILSHEAISIPRYIRLGKFMSKARVSASPIAFTLTESITQNVDGALLNPSDLPSESELLIFDMISVPPTPLVRHARIRGRFYHLEDGAFLPYDMAFHVEQLP